MLQAIDHSGNFVRSLIPFSNIPCLAFIPEMGN